jgi:DNA anti-recombination protein RmuC
MASPADSKSSANAEPDVKEGANVDKIRDILFGSQMRDYEKRFVRLEDRLTKDAEALREEVRKRFDSLEGFVQKEVESLGQRLKTEKSERAESLKDLGRELREAAKGIEKRIGSLDDQLAESTAEIRSKILDQSKALTAEIASKHRELVSLLDREVQALRVDKTDREALADLFAEFGMRLKNEFNLPDK